MPESQRLVFLIFSGVTGLLVGSFLNVCIFRLPRNCMSIVKPRSRCPKCLHFIAWYDNFPVVSWLLLGGKCRFCKVPISSRYVLVELLTGGLYLYAGWRALYGSPRPGPDQAVAFAVEAWFLAALIVCTFIDFDFRILPDEVTLSGIVIGLAVSTAFPAATHHKGSLLGFVNFILELLNAVGWVKAGPIPPATGGIWANPHVLSFIDSAFGALVGGGAVYAVGVMGKLLFRKEAMGFGDVKYMAMFGSVLGWRGVLFTFMVACLLGSVFGIGKFIVKRRMGYVPFGPFLSAGALSMLFWAPWVDRLVQAYMRFVYGALSRSPAPH
jgi:leader peptidase (prepilin peptidase) / N-methyltransferase